MASGQVSSLYFIHESPERILGLNHPWTWTLYQTCAVPTEATFTEKLLMHPAPTNPLPRKHGGHREQFHSEYTTRSGLPCPGLSPRMHHLLALPSMHHTSGHYSLTSCSFLSISMASWKRFSFSSVSAMVAWFCSS